MWYVTNFGKDEHDAYQAAIDGSGMSTLLSLQRNPMPADGADGYNPRNEDGSLKDWAENLHCLVCEDSYRDLSDFWNELSRIQGEEII